MKWNVSQEYVDRLVFETRRWTSFNRRPQLRVHGDLELPRGTTSQPQTRNYYLKSLDPILDRETMVEQHTIVVILSDFDKKLPSCEEEGSYLVFVVK